MIASIKKLVHAVDRLRRLLRAMPLSDAIRVECAAVPQEITVYLKAIGRHACIRSGTTDLKCLEKIFVDDEYRFPFDHFPQLIVDAGANIGMATLYFAHQYPHARIVAIEPEPSNFELLHRNCKGLSNVILLQGALWPSNSPLEIEDPTADAWTFRVVERATIRGSTAAVAAITIPAILERVGAKQIDLLKLDIEGSELHLFSDGANRWICLVKAIAIELHDRFMPGCAQAFYSVLVGEKFIQEIRGENIFVKLLDHDNLRH
jgi:FkbM family methyltransferase